MTKKRPSASTKARAKGNVTWTFSDKSTADMPLEEVFRQQLNQAAAASHSDDPQLRAWGDEQLRIHSEQMASDYLAPLKKSTDSTTAARAERPGARDPLRKKIVTVMKAERKSDTTLKTFLERWEQECIAGLHLVLDGDTYWVTDAETEGKKDYTLGTLTKLWSEAKPS